MPVNNGSYTAKLQFLKECGMDRTTKIKNFVVHRRAGKLSCWHLYVEPLKKAPGTQ